MRQRPEAGGLVARRLVDDEGSISVLTAFVAAALLAVVSAVLLVASASAAAHSARAAADLAALAGASALQSGGDPCAVAADVASVNRAGVVGCVVDGFDVVVRAEVAAALGVFGSRTASAVARAGTV